jgi:hypothetical protein
MSPLPCGHQGVLFDNARATIFRVRDYGFYKFWVYIMASPTGTLCVGVTGYFDRRVGQHKSRAMLERPCRAPGPRNAVSGTVPQENSLNRHGGGDIPGILRFALGRAAPSDSLGMTNVNGDSAPVSNLRHGVSRRYAQESQRLEFSALTNILVERCWALEY